MSALEIRNATPADVRELARLVAASRDHLNAKAPVDIEFACAWLDDEARRAQKLSLTTNEHNESHALYPGGLEVLWSWSVRAG